MMEGTRMRVGERFAVVVVANQTVSSPGVLA